MADEYRLRYDNVVTAYFPPFPKGFAGKAYQACLDYFESFTGFEENMEVLDVESRFSIDVGGNQIVGVADLICRDRDTGKLIVIDHKTTSENSFNKKHNEYLKQLYIYAAYVKQKYGEFPELLRFNLIKPQAYSDELFNIDTYNDTMNWITSTIDQIKAEQDWNAVVSNYFCKWLCGVSQYCEDGQKAWQK